MVSSPWIYLIWIAFLNIALHGLDVQLVVHNEYKSWHETADGSCNGNFTGEQALNPVFKDMVLKQLEEGDTAWLSGRSVNSDFITWGRCIDMSNGTLVKPGFTEMIMVGNPILKCFQRCNLTTGRWKYIGLQGRTCYCLDTIPKDAIVENSKCNSYCNYTYSHMSLETCVGIGNYTSTYAYATGPLPVNLENHKQGLTCTISFNTPEFSMASESLYSVQNGGALCWNLYISVNKKNSWNLEADGTNFKKLIVYETRQDWIEANSQCKLNNGIEFSVNNIKHKDVDILKNYTAQPIWTGAFRTFQVEFSATPKSREACAVVRHVKGDKLIIEPDACSNLNKYICTESITDGTSPTGDDGLGGDGVWMIILIGVGVVVLIVVLAAIISLYLRSKGRLVSTESTAERNRGLPNEYGETGCISDERQEIVVPHTDENRQCVTLGDVDKGGYSEVSLVNDNATRSHTNDMPEVGISKTHEDPYDRINLKTPQNEASMKLRSTIASQETDTYSHIATLGQGDNTYDTTYGVSVSTSSVPHTQTTQLGKRFDTYEHLQL